VLGAGALDQKHRLADALHHAGDKRMHGLDASHHVDLSRRARPACAAQDRQQRNSSNETTLQSSHCSLPTKLMTLYHYITPRQAQAPAGGPPPRTRQVAPPDS
jgi:hypothetical protein